MNKRGEWLFIAAAFVFLLLPPLLTGALVWASLAPSARQTLYELIAPHIGLVFLSLAILGVLAAALARYLWQLFPGEMLRLAEAARLMAGPNPAYRPTVEGVAAARELAQCLAQLAEQRDAAFREVIDEIRKGKAELELERNRLAALVAELPLPVMVCALDGRILLYNNLARLQAKALAPVGQASTVIGLGRSIYAVFERAQIAHGLEVVQHRLHRAGGQPHASFVTTTRAGQLLRVQMAPVVVPGEAEERQLAGFVLVLENITRAFEASQKTSESWLAFLSEARASLAVIREALQRLPSSSAMDAVRETGSREVDRLLGLIRRNEEEQGRHLASQWPLEEMLAADLAQLISRRMEDEAALTVKLDMPTENLWLRVDSYALALAFVFLATRLTESLALRLVRLVIEADEETVTLALIWAGGAFSTETVLSWQVEPMTIGERATLLTLREVVERHGGHLAHGRDSASQQAFFRLTLPRASGEGHQVQPLVRVESRPEFYDFDLFERADEDRALDEMPLAALTYTVFDTETTGLQPSAGDEIIQIGAVRVVNGRILRHESFDQLVDPRRPIPKAGIAVHGITEEMVAGQPTIDTVLPEFHAFAAGTVLVAHNAAFDLRFFELKEERLGIRFNQPLLDTLLLDAVVHPSQESHKLEAIAARLGIPIIGRHTALGDAIVTAEVFLRLIPLLAAQGIHTLGQARAASQKTYYARLKY